MRVIIPAAGLGSRMRPLSRGMSKCLIPVNGKPILSWIFEQLDKISAERMISDVVVVEGPQGDVGRFIEQTYDYKLNCRVPIQVVTQKKAAGPLDAIRIGMNVKNEARGPKELEYLIWLGDTIYLGMPKFEPNKSFIIGSQVPMETSARWCMAAQSPAMKSPMLFDKKELDEIEPWAKIAPSCAVALIGVYYIQDAILFEQIVDEIKAPGDKGEFQIAQALVPYMAESETKLIDGTNDWYDCGELETYYQSKSRLLNRSARECNRISINVHKGTVTKSSVSAKENAKIKAEADWFLSLEGYQKLYAPQVVQAGQRSGTPCFEYETGIVPGVALNELFMYDNVPAVQWIAIMRRVMDIYFRYFAKDMTVGTFDKQDIANALEMYMEKNIKRLEDHHEIYSQYFNDGQLMCLKKFIADTALGILTRARYQHPKKHCRIHGDLHLGNIIYEPFTNNVTFLDPRGVWGSSPVGTGEVHYDIGKLYHDWYCGYMNIVSGAYTIKDGRVVFPERLEKVRTQVLGFMDGYLGESFSTDLGHAMGIIFILTCIPFHLDNKKRCEALALRVTNLMEDEWAHSGWFPPRFDMPITVSSTNSGPTWTVMPKALDKRG